MPSSSSHLHQGLNNLSSPTVAAGGLPHTIKKVGELIEKLPSLQGPRTRENKKKNITRKIVFKTSEVISKERFSLEDYNFPSLKKETKEVSQKCVYKIQITNKHMKEKKVLITISKGNSSHCTQIP